MPIIYSIIRLGMFLLGVSITLAIVITTTKYLVGMFTALPSLIPVGIFIIILIVIFFMGGFDVK